MTVRTGMTAVIKDLRAMTEANTDEYRIGAEVYWTDQQLQDILDTHRTDLKWYEMTAIEEGDGSYLDYEIGYTNLEATTGGTAILFVQDFNGTTVTSPAFTADYRRGVLTFASDTNGDSYYVTGRSYDLQGAAAEVWRRKLGHYARAVDFSTDGHNISRSQLYQHAREMVTYYESLSNSGFETITLNRSDTDA